jgi:hypothetical protein
VEVSGLATASLQFLERAGWTAEHWQQLLAIYAQQDQTDQQSDLPPMAGEYRIRSDALILEPAFPLEPGVSYRAELNLAALPDSAGGLGELLRASYRLTPPAVGRPTLLTRVYPSARVLPENLLKFYLHFSAPMSRGHIYDYIHLRNAHGQDVELPFLEIDEELWDPTMTRLTLFLDPGRIKRGVRPLEEIGPALEAGREYTLFISQAWQDAAGHPLGADFEKAFRVSPPDREPINPARWKIELPSAGGHGVLAVDFHKPLDHALAQRSIRVADAAGVIVPGKVELTDDECRWSFVPDQPWKPDEHQLLISTTIEDLAGNNIGKPFDVDLFERVGSRLTQSVERVAFVIR